MFYNIQFQRARSAYSHVVMIAKATFGLYTLSIILQQLIQEPYLILVISIFPSQLLTTTIIFIHNTYMSTFLSIWCTTMLTFIWLNNTLLNGYLSKNLNISLFHFNTPIPHIIHLGKNWYFLINWALYQWPGGPHKYQQLHRALILLFICAPRIVTMKRCQELVKETDLSIDWYTVWMASLKCTKLINKIITWCIDCIW